MKCKICLREKKKMTNKNSQTVFLLYLNSICTLNKLLVTRKIKTIAVIPAFNEATRIQQVIDNTRNFVDEIIVVNDCSTDKTLEIAKSTGVTVIDLPYNRGAGFATRTGCDKALNLKADLIITLDADG